MDDEKKYPHMCGGVLATILLSYKKKIAGLNQNSFVTDLAKVVKPTVSLPDEKVLKTVASEYLNCRKETPATLPFSDKDYIGAFKRQMTEKYPLLLHRMDSFLRKYIDIDDIDTQDAIAREIYEIFGNDSICRRTPLKILPDGEVTAFRSLSDIHFQPFILGLWFYVISHRVNNHVDNELYDNWKSSNRGRFLLPGMVFIDSVPVISDEKVLEELVIPDEETILENDVFVETAEEIPAEEAEVHNDPEVLEFESVDPKTGAKNMTHIQIINNGSGPVIGQANGLVFHIN